MSLDETCLSNGEVYTFLTNKAAHGGSGALAAMVRGVVSDTVSAILKKVPRELRRGVRTVTTDLSSAMMLTVRTVFPKAKLINDRFHVQQLMSEAVDQMRIAFRWEVLAEENEAIKKHRAKSKAAHTRAEKDLIGEWEPERMANGETKPQIMARSRHIILMHRSNGMPSSRQGPRYSSGCFQNLRRRTTYTLTLWTYSTRRLYQELPGLTLPEGTMMSRTLDMKVSTRSSKPLKTTTKPSSTILKKGLPMHRLSRLMLKSRFSEHSSEASGMLGSSCIDWQHFIHNCPLPPTGKIR